jgi:hypothetical protein
MSKANHILTREFVEELFPNHVLKPIFLNCHANSGSYNDDYEQLNTWIAQERHIFVGYIMNDYLNTAILGYQGEEAFRDSPYSRGVNTFVVFDAFEATDGGNFTNFQFLGWMVARA